MLRDRRMRYAVVTTKTASFCCYPLPFKNDATVNVADLTRPELLKSALYLKLKRFENVLRAFAKDS